MSHPSSTSTDAADPQEGFSQVFPLDDFYARAGQPLPPIEEVPGEDVPEPCKTLLVHENDMTPTLEGFHGRSIHIRVLGRVRDGNSYQREVVLLLDGTEEPVEFGAIRIFLDRFDPESREQILAESRPLGRILKECTIVHDSRPKAFLKTEADALICEALQLKAPATLYGRRNTLTNPEGLPLAEIVEILPTRPSETH